MNYYYIVLYTCVCLYLHEYCLSLFFCICKVNILLITILKASISFYKNNYNMYNMVYGSSRVRRRRQTTVGP